jgi:hypothetical protein
VGGHRVEVEECTEHHLLAGLGGRDDRARAVRGREDQRLRPRLLELARRRRRVEALHALRIALARR